MGSPVLFVFMVDQWLEAVPADSRTVSTADAISGLNRRDLK